MRAWFGGLLALALGVGSEKAAQVVRAPDGAV